ncbi:MAG: glycerol-3-phosphate 1-O-acyltransferase PlsY [Burkholderiales bacterium]|nr:glycerol-3-phosphate 1-O-acyltransferase PlsY [Burkholderiales bacterium]
MSLLFGLVAYLIGSVSFAVVVSKAFGLADPRTYGSKNPGATNVLRSGSKVAAALTLLGDALKGGVAVLLAQTFASRFGVGEGAIALAAIGAFLGHLYPLYHRFRGGKGVATALGILLAVDPWLGLGTLATWLIIAFFFRYSSLAALVSAVFAPFYHASFWDRGVMTLAIGAMSLLLVWRHRANIGKLLAGTEARLGGKARP